MPTTRGGRKAAEYSRGGKPGCAEKSSGRRRVPRIWRQISINPEDTELFASRKFTVEELARLFNVPPPIIGDLQYGIFSNVETLLRWSVQNTLSPWIRKIESEFSRNIFGASRATHWLEIALSGLMRGDPAQRWQAWEIAVRNNILTPDEVRQEEGWNPKSAQTV